MSQTPLLPESLHTALEVAAALGRFDSLALAALLGAPADEALAGLLAAGAAVPDGEAFRYSAAESPLAGAPRRAAELHAQAAQHYRARMEAGESGAARAYADQLARCCELLIRTDPAALAPLLADLPLEQLERPDQQLLRYYAGLGEGLADRLAQARAIFAELLGEPGLAPALRGRALNSSALFAQMQGDHQAALDAYRDSFAIWEQIGERLRQANVLHNLGILRYELHELEEAAAQFQAAAAIYAELEDSHHLAMSYNELGLVYRDEGRWQDALDTLGRAAATFEAGGAEHMLGIVLGNLGEVELACGHYAAARERLGRALELMTSQVYAVDYRINLGLIEQAAGDHAPALEHYRAAQQVADQLGRREIAALIHYRVGHALERLGRPDEARQSYAAAMEAVEQVRQPLRDEGLLISLMGRWQLVYEAAFLLCMAQGDLTGAFDVSERARARAFADQLARYGADEPGQARPITAEEARAALAPDTLLLSYFATGLRGREARLLEAMPPAAEGLRECLATPARLTPLALTRAQVTTFACPLSPDALQSGAGRSDGARFLAPRVLRHAYDALVAPVAEAIGAARELVIVPHGPLHQLPFAALADASQRALLDQARRIWHAPSATVRLRAAPRPPDAPPLACLAVSHDGGAGELRHTGPEARAVAKRCGGDLWVSQAGARQRLIAEAGRYRFLHLACHGVFDLDDPQASWLELGPGERLTAAEVHAELRISAELVVLSACRSGVSRVLRGDEPIGLARAFLGAGARAVLVTLWPVEDSSARLLIERFYAELLRGAARADAPDAAAALRTAQVALRGMSAGEAAAQLGAPPPVAGPQPYADPRFWAAYVLVAGAG